MSWHAGRSDDFRSPIVRGMTRTSPKERARQRVLTDDELRAVWKAADDQRRQAGRTCQRADNRRQPRTGRSLTVSWVWVYLRAIN